MKLTNNTKRNNSQSKIDELKMDLKNLRVARKMNKAKICETKAKIRLEKQQAKTDRIKSTVNKYQQEYYKLAKEQSHSARIENRIALGVR